jgi:hypothetical protein
LHHILFATFFPCVFSNHGYKVNVSLININHQGCCRNPSLGLATKARVRKSAGQEESSRVWENVKMNNHTPKWTPILGIGVSMDSQNFRERLQRSKPLALRSSL